MSSTLKLWLVLIVAISRENAQETFLSPIVVVVPGTPCNDNSNVKAYYRSGKAPNEENQYELLLEGEELDELDIIELKFDSDATLTLNGSPAARLRTDPSGFFYAIFFKRTNSFHVTVRGPENGTIPYLRSLKLKHHEICKEPNVGYFDNFLQGYLLTAEYRSPLPNDSCGRRKVVHTELIVNGQPTVPGDWPWHVALFRVEGRFVKYICGGTLLSKTLVLTAAHCASVKGAPVLPQSINVVLGKHNLIGGDIAPQEREVFEVIVHPGFDVRTLNNDIALLKLKTEAIFNDYIQPACLWDSNSEKRLSATELFGTVVGWGLDNKDVLSTTLQQVTMPKISEAACLKNNPVFFQKTLNSLKFCAGYTNGTSVCNGDSGGGFLVFVPDVIEDQNSKSGTWHVHGIVSLTLKRIDASVCDPNQYALFTDVVKYQDWIMKYLGN